MPEYLPFAQRWRVEDLRPSSPDARFGAVTIDPERCKGCDLCARVCPANSITLVEKKARMIEVLPMCMSCGDCLAICPEEAISISSFIEFYRFFRYLNRGRAEPPRRF